MGHSLMTREGVMGILKERKCNPFEIMADIALDTKIDPPTRARCAAELANYVAPKLKATEITLTPERPNAQPVDLSKFKRPPKTVTQVTKELQAEILQADSTVAEIVLPADEYATIDEDEF